MIRKDFNARLYIVVLIAVLASFAAGMITKTEAILSWILLNSQYILTYVVKNYERKNNSHL